MSISYQSEGSIFHAPVMRVDDEGHGFLGVVYHATTRHSEDFDTGKLKWFHNKGLIKTNEPPKGAEPVLDYIFHVAVESGRGAFTKRDENGDPIKLSSGKNATEVRQVTEEDIVIVASAAWLSRAVKSVRLNEGHKARLKRLTPARDENGDRMTDVRCEIAVLEKVANPKPYDEARAVPDENAIYDRAPADDTPAERQPVAAEF